MNTRKYDSKVRCYDCNEYVYNLRSHRGECPNSRRAKSLVTARRPRENNAVLRNTTDFYMLLDVSSSMNGQRLLDAKQTLTDIEEMMGDTDRMAVITFDTNAYFKLKPRPVGQLRRQNELPELLSRIYAQGLTAVWDAIWMAVSQLRDKTRETLIIVLTDGQDNSSKHTFSQVQNLLQEYPNIKLSVIHVDNNGTVCTEYEQLCANHRGMYKVVPETEIVITVKTVFRKYWPL